MEGINKIPEPVIYEIDVSEGWDTPSQMEIFWKEVKKLPFYSPNLLYSGFDADEIGKSWSSNEDGVVFCNKEDKFIFGDYDINNPYWYAMKYENPAIAIYDQSKMQHSDIIHEISKEIIGESDEGYKMKDPSALLAIITFKFDVK